MRYGAAIALAGLFIGTGLAVSGLASNFGKQYQLQQTQAACWSPQTTTGLNDLAKQVAMPSFKSSFPSTLAASDQDAVSSSLAMTVSDFSFTGASADGGVINCQAGMSYTYTRPDKSVFNSQGGDIIAFVVHPTQGGYTSEMNGTDIPLGTVTYTDDPNPPPPTPVVPPSSSVTAIPPEVADFDQGHADRMKYENWVTGLQGPESEGAVFWSGQRSLNNPESCSDGASAAYPNDSDSQSTFENGCQEDKDFLGPLDVKRNTDPLYKAGWNSPVSQ